MVERIGIRGTQHLIDRNRVLMMAAGDFFLNLLANVINAAVKKYWGRLFYFFISQRNGTGVSGKI